MKTTTYSKRSATCTICNCTIMVRLKPGIKPSLMLALAVADHTKTMHAGKLAK